MDGFGGKTAPISQKAGKKSPKTPMNQRPFLNVISATVNTHVKYMIESNDNKNNSRNVISAPCCLNAEIRKSTIQETLYRLRIVLPLF
jgi:hypothetical protein